MKSEMNQTISQIVYKSQDWFTVIIIFHIHSYPKYENSRRASELFGSSLF